VNVEFILWFKTLQGALLVATYLLKNEKMTTLPDQVTLRGGAQALIRLLEDL